MTPKPYPASISVGGEDYAVMVTERSTTDFLAVVESPFSGHSVASFEGRGGSEEAALADVGQQLAEALKREDAAEG